MCCLSWEEPSDQEEHDEEAEDFQGSQMTNSGRRRTWEEDSAWGKDRSHEDEGDW